LKNIEKYQLGKVLDWYNTAGEYRYATGTEGYVSKEMLEKRYEVIRESEHDFFLGIHNTNSSESGYLMGTMVGSIVDNVLWIKLLAVDSRYRSRGVGSMSTALFLNFIRSDGYAKDVFLSVVEKNQDGLRFWLKNGFHKLTIVEKRLSYEGLNSDIIIMKRKLI